MTLNKMSDRQKGELAHWATAATCLLSRHGDRNSEPRCNCVPVILAFGRKRQEDQEFSAIVCLPYKLEVSLG